MRRVQTCVRGAFVLSLGMVSCPHSSVNFNAPLVSLLATPGVSSLIAGRSCCDLRMPEQTHYDGQRSSRFGRGDSKRVAVQRLPPSVRGVRICWNEKFFSFWQSTDSSSLGHPELDSHRLACALGCQETAFSPEIAEALEGSNARHSNIHVSDCQCFGHSSPSQTIVRAKIRSSK